MIVLVLRCLYVELEVHIDILDVAHCYWHTLWQSQFRWLSFSLVRINCGPLFDKQVLLLDEVQLAFPLQPVQLGVG